LLNLSAGLVLAALLGRCAAGGLATGLGLHVWVHRQLRYRKKIRLLCTNFLLLRMFAASSSKQTKMPDSDLLVSHSD
jgi:hypothetical protein